MPRGKRHYRITFSDALSAHDRALQNGGGREGMLNPSLVDSAISRPYTGYYRPIACKAAALVQSVATNHGFTDGNKRTALILLHTLLFKILLHTLLFKSDYKLVPLEIDQSMDDAAETMVMAIVTREFDFETLVEWFKNRITSVH